MQRYRKTISAVVGAILGTLPLVWDLRIELEEAMTLVFIWASAFGVYQLPNDPPPGKKAKKSVSERG